MPTENQGREMLKEKEMQKSINDDYYLYCLAAQSESEIKWVELHQMFDR